MKTIIITLIFIVCVATNAQVEPILDHTWTIEKIVTEDETIMADLNPLGEYDQLSFYNEIELDNSIFYPSGIINCSYYTYFNPSEQFFYNHLLGCTLSSDGSSDIVEIFNYGFIQGSEEVTLNNEFVPDAYGPFNYEFRYEGDLIYLDITNTEGDVATFWASTLSNANFDKTQFSIYPNPVTNQLHVASEQAKIERVEIYNLNGKQVLNINFQNNQPIDVSSLTKGLYLVKVKTESGSLTKKLIK